jgi:hypothetical protein
LQQLGGKTAYTANIKINGGSGKLSVTGFDDLNGSAASNIRQLFELPPTQPAQSPATDIFILKGKNKTTRLVLLHLPKKHKLLAITITQPNSEYIKSYTPPKYSISDIPPYPASSTRFSAADENAKLQICVSTTTAPPESVASFYNSMLKSAGWLPFLADKQGSVTQTSIYQRHNNICFIMPTITKSGQTSICIVHKQLSAQ